MSSRHPHADGGSVRSLWRRAPLWRFTVLAAGFLTFLSVLYPPSRHPPDEPTQHSSAMNGAAYRRPAPGVPRTAVNASTSPAASWPGGDPAAAPGVSPRPNPKTATLSLARPEAPGSAAAASGIDPAVLGRTYHDQVLVNGFMVPLPPGEWAVLANSSARAIKNPENTGMSYFLARIAAKRLVGAVLVTALRSPAPGSGFAEFEGCRNADFPYIAREEIIPFDHQSCWLIHNFFTPPWQQWADNAIKISNLMRAAAGDMAAKGVTYPQDLVAVQMYRSEKFGLLDVTYLFSPESEHIESNVALSFRDSDWFGPHLQRHPEKAAYTEKLKAWGASFWPGFKKAFDDGR